MYFFLWGMLNLHPNQLPSSINNSKKTKRKKKIRISTLPPSALLFFFFLSQGLKPWLAWNLLRGGPPPAACLACSLYKNNRQAPPPCPASFKLCSFWYPSLSNRQTELPLRQTELGSSPRTQAKDSPWYTEKGHGVSRVLKTLLKM